MQKHKGMVISLRGVGGGVTLCVKLTQSINNMWDKQMENVFFIYGCIGSALLWYNNISATFEGIGLEINPYDSFFTNKSIEDTQCTIAWYVYDNKFSQ